MMRDQRASLAIVLGMVLLGAAGCGSSAAGDDPCGSGDSVRTAGHAYCVYRGAIVIETGFECPVEVPFRIDLDGGVVCADREAGREELPGEVCTRLPSGCRDPDGGSARDAGGRDAGPPGDAGDDCGIVECLRAVECVERCGGPIVQSGCCPCPAGTLDSQIECRGLADGQPCTTDAECGSGLCYGSADMSGVFLEPVCQSACLPMDDRGHYCRNDTHCCSGSCSLGSGELEGLCRPAGTLAEGESCGGGLGECEAGLSCCYPCGIPGCTNVCEPTCADGTPGCAGGCMLRP